MEISGIHLWQKALFPPTYRLLCKQSYFNGQVYEDPWKFSLRPYTSLEMTFYTKVAFFLSLCMVSNYSSTTKCCFHISSRNWGRCKEGWSFGSLVHFIHCSPLVLKQLQVLFLSIYIFTSSVEELKLEPIHCLTIIFFVCYSNQDHQYIIFPIISHQIHYLLVNKK